MDEMDLGACCCVWEDCRAAESRWDVIWGEEFEDVGDAGDAMMNTKGEILVVL